MEQSSLTSLANSVRLRYLELHGHSFLPPEDFSAEDRIIQLARELRATHRDTLLDASPYFWLAVAEQFTKEVTPKTVR